MARKPLQEEFKSDDKFSTVPEPTVKGKTVKTDNDDKTSGEKQDSVDKKKVPEHRLATKAGYMQEVMKVLGDMSKEEVEAVLEKTKKMKEGDDEDDDKNDDDDKDEKGKKEFPFKKKKDKDKDDDDGDDDVDVNVKIEKEGKKKKYEDYKVKKEDLQMDFDVDKIFEGKEFTDDFKTKVSTVFETAVLTAINEQIKTIVSDQEEQIALAVSEELEGLVDKIDQYLNLTVEEFMEENKLAVETGIRLEMMESFFESMKTVFTEHYVEIPEDKTDLFDELESKVNRLEGDLNEEIEKNLSLRDELETIQREEVLEDISEAHSFTEVQKDQVRTLSENVEFENKEDFQEKVETIVNTFVEEKEITLESDDEDTLVQEEDKKQFSPMINSVLKQLTSPSQR